jgi:3-oxoacyl-[acyl-carrier protein] reductase
MDLSLEGKIAIVTGGSAGIGRGISDALVDEGCHVCICSRHEGEVQQAAKELEDRSADDVRTLGVAADLTNEADRQKLVDEVVRTFSTVDILVNNAGTLSAGETLEDWRSLFELSLFAVVDLVDRVIPYMQEKGWGRIINVSSENGEQPYPDMIPYSATKGALNNFSKGLSKRHAEDGILVNTVSPAFIETPLVEGIMEEAAEEQGITKEEAVQQFLENNRPNIELKRPGRIDEVGALVAFLASEKASFINGANYRIDSGSVTSV